ncbi:MAG: hypothetical protein SH809_19255 [Rhodothermales bacterium]|nr:hypothetical protein [Rhodothermales bacterium]
MIGYPVRFMIVCLPFLIGMAGCDGFFPSLCNNDYTEHELELWLFSLDGTQPIKLKNEFEAEYEFPQSDRYSLVGVSADASFLYYTYEDYSDTTSSLFARDLRSGLNNRVAFEPGDHAFRLSPDRVWFAYLRGEKALWVAHTDGSEARKIDEVTEGQMSPGIWPNDGHIAFSPDGKGIFLASLSGDRTSRLSSADSIDTFDVAPDLKTVAYTRLVRGWNGNTGFGALAYVEDEMGAVFVGDGRSGLDFPVAFAAEGDRLLYAGPESYSLVLVDLTDSNHSPITVSETTSIEGLVVAPSGDQLVYIADQFFNRIILATGAKALIQDAQALPANEDSFWDSIRTRPQKFVFGPNEGEIYVLIDQEKFSDGCD